MKKLFLFAAILLGLSAQAQTVTTDANTGKSQALTNRVYVPQLGDSVDTRILAQFSINASATVATTRWNYQYKVVYDSVNYAWKDMGIDGSFTLPISFDSLVTNLFRNIRDSTLLKNTNFR